MRKAYPDLLPYNFLDWMVIMVMSKHNRFHACATCQHYEVVKSQERTRYHCSRLGYDTRPHYQFNCWQPKENVLKLMEKEQKN
ncbi:hypothetical protein [Sutcliffiella rhizosphaerae]|uniref:hypothetical protein n=1 Tax=Sutcliffiella rhizosphaerae TaxID=2880967 RepID=UPI00295F378D|nr:hypothetical protein [Sutcliffiella rhizosphaerae]